MFRTLIELVPLGNEFVDERGYLGLIQPIFNPLNLPATQFNEFVLAFGAVFPHESLLPLAIISVAQAGSVSITRW